MMEEWTYGESEKLYRSAVMIPGRSHTRSKAPGRLFDVGCGPLYARGGTGALLVDVDGHAYIDMLCALGAVSLGYGRHRSGRYGVCSLPLDLEIQASHAILKDVAPWASQIRLLRTGSEATHAAYRIARQATGRPTVLLGESAYHGWHEWCSRENTQARFYKPATQTWVDDIEPNQVAAVFVEPSRWVTETKGWLEVVRRYCDCHGALLVFDEMIYGGRWALGGATEYFGVQPDVACFGKAIGNGAPVACVVGNQVLAEHGEVVSGTYAGDGDAAQAVLDTLAVYTAEPVIETLWDRGQQLLAGLEGAIVATGWTGRVTREGAPVHQRLRFAEPALGRAFAAQMAARGVLWHPDCANVCYAHTAGHMNRVIEAVHESLAALGS